MGDEATLKDESSTSTTVRLTPSTATDPFAAIWVSRGLGHAKRHVIQSCS